MAERGTPVSKLVFNYDDFSRRGIEKYRVDLQRRAIATGVIGPCDVIEVERHGLHMEVETLVTHIDSLGYTLIDDKYAVQDVKDVKATEARAKKRWWRR